MAALGSRSKLKHLATTTTRQLFNDRPSKRRPFSSQLHRYSSSGEGNFNDEGNDAVPSRPLSDILKELNKKVPDALLRHRIENDIALKYIPWLSVFNHLKLENTLTCLGTNAESSGEVRSISYSPDGKSVSVVYRVTIYGTDAEIFRESTGTAAVNSSSYGDPVQMAEAMAFRRACARFGLGLHLYHEDAS